MGDIKEGPVLPAVHGGIHDGVLVLDGHTPPSKRHHLAWTAERRLEKAIGCLERVPALSRARGDSEAGRCLR